MSRKVRKNVGVIGLGIIGSRVSTGLRAAGYQVYVWNRSAKPAPNFLGSPAEVAESAEIIQLFVADGQALVDVIEAMSDALTSKHVIVCNATVGPEAVIEAGKMVQACGAQFLDAPFTGSKVAAEKRQLVYYVGGPEAAFLRVRPLLELTSKSIIRMGGIGDASTIKVVTNMISAVTVQVLAEALSIVQKSGLEPELLTAAIESNACRSGVIDLKLPKMMSGDFEPHFSLKHMFKDVQLGIHLANGLDIEIPATTVTAGVMYGALNQGWGDMDFSVLFKNYMPSAIFEALPSIEHVLSQVPAIAESTPESEGVVIAEPPVAVPAALAAVSPVVPETPAEKETAAATSAPASVIEPEEPILPMAASVPAPIPASWEVVPPPVEKVMPAEPEVLPPAVEVAPPPAEVTPAPIEVMASEADAVSSAAEAGPLAASVAASAVNGSSVREVVPMEEAARIIEAVLTHISNQRGEVSKAAHENRRRATRIGRTSMGATAAGPTSTVKKASAEKQADAAVVLAEPVAEQAAATKPAETASTAAEPDPKPEDDPKAEFKPINFVRRWFVGRTQG